jgi:hypothetical protein
MWKSGDLAAIPRRYMVSVALIQASLLIGLALVADGPIAILRERYGP